MDPPLLRALADPLRQRIVELLAVEQLCTCHLVDELSASTTEILAAALQRLGRARVFGTPSAGQALPALLTKLPNGDRLMYVIGDFAGPAGGRLEGAGVSPDQPTPRSRSALLAGRDDALDAAVRWVQDSPHPVKPK